MSDILKKVEDSSGFYTNNFIDFDFLLANYGYETLSKFFRGKNALELGPASGYMTKQLQKDFLSLDIVEGSLNLLNQIQEYPNVYKYHSLFENFDSEKKYDTIIMSHVLEHINDPLLVLKKIYNWLDADGVFIVAVPNAKSLHRMAAVEMGLLESVYQLNERDHQLGHYRVYDTDLLLKDLKHAGFRIETNGGYFLKPVSNGQIEEHWSQEMKDGFYKLGKQFQENCAEIYAICTK